MSRKLKIAVLFGGRSPEYGVSLQSAAAVLRHMDRRAYEPVMVGISREGSWFHYTGPVSRVEDGSWLSGETSRAALVPGCPALLVWAEGTLRPIPLDAVFPVLHGQNGEDGTVQGLVELSGIPLVGCGVLASALCMDKDRAHKLVHAAGIAVPESFVVRQTEGAAAEQAEALGYPLFVKPLRAGSSFGITRAAKPEDLPAALEAAFSYSEQAIVETCVPGFEVGCAVLGSEVLTVGEPDEIALSGDFFSYGEKYSLKTSTIHVPARVTADRRRQIQENAKIIYRVLDCRGFARVDQFLTPEGRLVFNEVNTIPGFTAYSRYPNMMKAAGLSFERVISSLIELAVGHENG